MSSEGAVVDKQVRLAEHLSFARLEDVDQLRKVRHWEVSTVVRIQPELTLNL